MSQIRRDDRRSVRYTGSSEVSCDLAPVRPSDVTSRPVVRCSGHIDRATFERLTIPDWCRLFDIASDWGFGDAVDQNDPTSACRTDAIKRQGSGRVQQFKSRCLDSLERAALV